MSHFKWHFLYTYTIWNGDSDSLQSESQTQFNFTGHNEKVFVSS